MTEAGPRPEEGLQRTGWPSGVRGEERREVEILGWLEKARAAAITGRRCDGGRPRGREEGASAHATPRRWKQRKLSRGGSLCNLPQGLPPRGDACCDRPRPCRCDRRRIARLRPTVAGLIWPMLTERSTQVRPTSAQIRSELVGKQRRIGRCWPVPWVCLGVCSVGRPTGGAGPPARSRERGRSKCWPGVGAHGPDVDERAAASGVPFPVNDLLDRIPRSRPASPPNQRGANWAEAGPKSAQLRSSWAHKVGRFGPCRCVNLALQLAADLVKSGPASTD